MPISAKNLLAGKPFAQKYERVDAPDSPQHPSKDKQQKAAAGEPPGRPAAAQATAGPSTHVNGTTPAPEAPPRVPTPPPAHSGPVSVLDSPRSPVPSSGANVNSHPRQQQYQAPDLISLEDPSDEHHHHHQQQGQHAKQPAAAQQAAPQQAQGPASSAAAAGSGADKPSKQKPKKRWVSQRRKRNSILPAVDKGVADQLWQALRSETGQMQSMMELLRAVQAGGVARHLRPEVWPLLLGCIAPEDSYEVQARKLVQVEEEFSRLLSLAQLRGAAKQHFESRGATEEWETTQRRIFTDATRVGLDGPLLQGVSREASVHRLERILLAYALMDPATGYCQGMADLAAPFIHLYARDHKAYWAFRALMTSLRDNFAEGLAAIRQQMAQLKAVMAVVDPPLFKHLEKLGAQEFELAFQMFLVLFRRELPWEQTFQFWEMLWACEALAQEPLKVHCAAALFEAHRRTLLKFDSCDELVTFVNGIPGEIEVEGLVRDAFSIWRHMREGRSASVCCVSFASGSRELKLD